jgi:hypothetical protein
MMVEGRNVPTEVIELLAAKVAALSVGCLWLKGAPDICEVFSSPGEITRETAIVLQHQESYRIPPRDASKPIDVSKDIWVDPGNLLCFARSTAGNPFCFDYSEGANEPCVVWWNNIGWRKLATSPRRFLALVPRHSS